MSAQNVVIRVERTDGTYGRCFLSNGHVYGAVNFAFNVTLIGLLLKRPNQVHLAEQLAGQFLA